jgi:2-methylisocitrate lyase-like PEP mutase family enzyme
MTTQVDRAQRFLALHRAGEPLLMPNPWDLGSARLLASLGFAALATTSSGFAATLGRNDGAVSRDEALVHAAVIVAATDLPVSADLENGFADSPSGVAETMRMAIEVGLAGASVEDFTGQADDPIYATGAAAAWSLPPARRTTCTAAPTWPTRSPGCRHSRRRAPTCSTPPACAAGKTSARSSAR